MQLIKCSLSKRMSLCTIRTARQYSTKYPPPPSYYDRKPRSYKSLYLFSFLTGACISYSYSIHEIADSLYPLPNSEDEGEKKKYIEGLESKLNSLQIVQKLSNDPKYTKSRPWENLDELPSGMSQFRKTLATPGGIAIPPMVFHKQDTGDDIVIVHLGKRLSGYPFLVHGGILGTVIDEVFKSNVNTEFKFNDTKKLHTTSLELSYKFPTFVDSFVIITSSVAKVNDEYVVSGDVSNTKGTLLVEAKTKVREGPATEANVHKTNYFW